MDSTNVSKLWQGWTPPEGLNRSWPRPSVLTGRGIKDPQTAILHNGGKVIECQADLSAIEEAVLGD